MAAVAERFKTIIEQNIKKLNYSEGTFSHMRANMQWHGYIGCCYVTNHVTSRVAGLRAKREQGAPPNQMVSLPFSPLWGSWKQENTTRPYTAKVLMRS